MNNKNIRYPTKSSYKSSYYSSDKKDSMYALIKKERREQEKGFCTING